MRKGALLLPCLLVAACHTEVQPIVIDLSRKTPTPSVAPAETPRPLPAETTTAPPPPVEAAPAPSVAVTPTPASRPAAGSPEQIVDGHLAARNRGDLEELLSFYAPDARIHEHPGERVRSGREQIREFYARDFRESPQLRTSVTGRIVQGNYVAQREEVSAGTDGRVGAIAIYEIRDGKIANVWRMR